MKRVVLYTCILFLLPLQIIAKNKDSLASKDYAYLIQQLDDRIEDKDNPLVKIYLEAYIKKAKKKKDKLNLFYAYKEGIYFSDNLDTQLQYADSAISMGVKMQNKELIAIAFLSKGVAFYKVKDFHQALQNYLNADNQLQKSKDQYLKHKVMFNMAMIKQKLNYYSQAEELLKQCENFFASNKENKNYQAYWLNTIYHLGSLHQETANKTKAKEYNLIGSNKSKMYNNEYFNKYFEINNGIDKILNNQKNQGIQSLTATELFLKKEKDFNTLTRVYYYKAIAYENLKMNEQKVEYFNKIDSIFNEHNYLEFRYKAIYEVLLREAMASLNTNRQLYLINQLLKVEEQNLISDIEMNQLVYKEYDTAQLLQLKQKIQHKSQLLNYIIAVTILGMIAIVAWGLKNKRKNNELKEKYSKFIQQSTQREKKNTMIDMNEHSESTIETMKMLLIKFEQFENQKEFLDPNITIATLAKSFSTNTTYLSKFFNQYKGINFSSYIKHLRIKYITQLLQEEPYYLNYKVSALSEIAGYTNPRQFSNIFLIETGLRPIEFIKIQKLENLQKQ
ncbi:helix-turn-helix domain-containing protein [Empedobacter brevis]|uniref:helix-turn-helix domain-containing protein n=1 Tax=Empedobacter brevis TaxID=247 RepID=UPI0039AF6076